MTLLQVLVVLAMVALIAGTIVVVVYPDLRQARLDRTTLELASLDQALKSYAARTGAFPDSGRGLRALVDPGLLPAVPRDGWGRPFVYALEGGRPRVTSYGEDGLPGGTGLDADLTNAPAPEAGEAAR